MLLSRLENYQGDKICIHELIGRMIRPCRNLIEALYPLIWVASPITGLLTSVKDSSHVFSRAKSLITSATMLINFATGVRLINGCATCVGFFIISRKIHRLQLHGFPTTPFTLPKPQSLASCVSIHLIHFAVTTLWYALLFFHTELLISSFWWLWFILKVEWERVKFF